MIGADKAASEKVNWNDWRYVNDENQSDDMLRTSLETFSALQNP